MKYSRQRRLILDIVKSNPVHPTAEWVYQQAREKMPSLGIATVYRNLNALTSIGEIERISGNDGIDRFDGNAAEHYHMQCCKCGRLIDLKAKDTAAVEQLRKVINTTFDVTGENITVTTTLLQGVCDQCADTEN